MSGGPFPLPTSTDAQRWARRRRRRAWACRSRCRLAQRWPPRHALRSGRRARRPGRPVAGRRCHLGSSLSRDAAVRRSGPARCTRRVGITDDELRWVETKTGYYGPDRILRSVSNAVEFLKLPGPVADRQAAPRRHHRRRLEDSQRPQDGAHHRRTVVAAVERQHGVRHVLEATAAGQARRLVPAGVGRVHLGHHPTALRGSSKRAEEGDVRLRARVVTHACASVRLVAWRRPASRCGSRRRCSASLVKRDALAGAAADGARTPSSTVSWSPPRRRSPRAVPRPDGRRARAPASGCEYLGIVCVSLLLDRPLAPYYLTYITDPATPFTAVVEMTSFIDPAELGGKSLVYLPKYTPPDDPLFAAIRRRRGRHVPAVPAADVPRPRPPTRSRPLAGVEGAARLRRPVAGYSDDAPSIGTSVPGLYLAGSANLPFSTLNVNDTLSLVDDVLVGCRTTAAATVRQLPRDRSSCECIQEAGVAVAGRGQPVGVPDDPRRSGLGHVPDLPRCAVPTSCCRCSTTSACASRSSWSARTRPSRRTIDAIASHRRRRPRDRQPQLPPPALAAPLLARARSTPSWGAPRTRIDAVTGQRPVGFRGPGLQPQPRRAAACSMDRGYEYDCSHACRRSSARWRRRYYFRSAKLDAQRSGPSVRHLFGSCRDGLQPLKPYRWVAGPQSLRGDPRHHDAAGACADPHLATCCTSPAPSPAAAYRTSRRPCGCAALRGVQPSILLHPLDFLGADDVDSLQFFPGMSLTGARKRETVRALPARCSASGSTSCPCANTRRALAAGHVACAARVAARSRRLREQRGRRMSSDAADWSRCWCPRTTRR